MGMGLHLHARWHRYIIIANNRVATVNQHMTTSKKSLARASIFGTGDWDSI